MSSSIPTSSKVRVSVAKRQELLRNELNKCIKQVDQTKARMANHKEAMDFYNEPQQEILLCEQQRICKKLKSQTRLLLREFCAFCITNHRKPQKDLQKIREFEERYCLLQRQLENLCKQYNNICS